MTKRVFLTGISGFIGKEIAIELMNRGYAVHGAIRFRDHEPSLRKALEYALDSSDLPLTLEHLELDHASGWAKALRGHDNLIHTASHVPVVMPRNQAAILGPALDGTKIVLRAAKASGVRRVILTSSVTAITEGHRFKGKRTFDETHWSDLNGRKMTAYAASKTVAERLAWSLAQEEDCPYSLTTLLPGVTMGPMREHRAAASLAMVTRLIRGLDPAQPNFGFTHVDVRDVARCHVDALEKDKAKGERIALTNGFLWYPQIASFIEEKFPELELKTRRMPSAIVRVFAPYKPRLRSFAPHLDRHADVSNAKALSIFNQPFINLDRMLTDTVSSILDKTENLPKNIKSKS